MRQLKTLQELSREPVLTDEEITVKVEYKNIRIRLAEIIYIEAMDNYVRIHLLHGRQVLSQISLKNLLELLPKEFVRIHKSFVVPLYRVESYSRTGITLYNSDVTIPIGRAFYTDFMERMNCKGN